MRFNYNKHTLRLLSKLYRTSVSCSTCQHKVKLNLNIWAQYSSLRHASALQLCVLFKYFLTDFSQTTHHQTQISPAAAVAWWFPSATYFLISPLSGLHAACCWDLILNPPPVNFSFLISLCDRTESDAMWLVWQRRVCVLNKERDSEFDEFWFTVWEKPGIS